MWSFGLKTQQLMILGLKRDFKGYLIQVSNGIDKEDLSWI